jgi:hypothetical protein
VHTVAVRILHPAATAAGPLERALLDARGDNAARLAGLFVAVGADDVRQITVEGGEGSFGARLRALVEAIGRGGLIVLGSGAIPLATARDVARFVDAARSLGRTALVNNRFSADVIAVGRADLLAGTPDLPSDNALPRWLEEVAGISVADLRDRRRLQVDLDTPLDAVLIGHRLPGIDAALALDRLAAIRSVANDRRAELLVAGRTSAATLRWLERSTASRVRALVEERGLRASSREALTAGPAGAAVRPPRSALGMLLDDRGPEALGAILAELADAALIDTRVLLAHRLGVEERRWPTGEDRFASDLLLVDQVRDPWLRALTASAREAAIPVILGGHSLVGPGVRLALRQRRGSG